LVGLIFSLVVVGSAFAGLLPFALLFEKQKIENTDKEI